MVFLDVPNSSVSWMCTATFCQSSLCGKLDVYVTTPDFLHWTTCLRQWGGSWALLQWLQRQTFAACCILENCLKRGLCSTTDRGKMESRPQPLSCSCLISSLDGSRGDATDIQLPAQLLYPLKKMKFVSLNVLKVLVRSDCQRIPIFITIGLKWLNLDFLWHSLCGLCYKKKEQISEFEQIMLQKDVSVVWLDKNLSCIEEKPTLFPRVYLGRNDTILSLKEKLQLEQGTL